MNITDELERLSQLRKDGALTDEEFAQAKQKLLNQDIQSVPPPQSDWRGENSLGEAANRYVTFRMAMGIIGLIIFLLFFFGVFLPAFTSQGHHF